MGNGGNYNLDRKTGITHPSAKQDNLLEHPEADDYAKNLNCISLNSHTPIHTHTHLLIPHIRLNKITPIYHK